MRKQVLVVDDSKFNRELLREILSGTYDVVEAENGKIALDYVVAHNDELIAVLLDIVMPVMDGVELLKIMSEKKLMRNFPVIVVTGEQPNGIVEECFEYGISDFIRKPIRSSLIQKRVRKQVELYLQRNEFKEMVERQTLTVRNQYNLLQQQSNKLKQTNEQIITVIGMLVEFRNLRNGDHIHHIKEITRILGKQYMNDYPESGLTQETIDMIVSVSALYDIGKIFVPDSILKKPGKLTDDEYAFMQSHAIRGAEALEGMKLGWPAEYSKTCYDICRSHHERYDGSGYPDGLEGDNIPLAAQLVSVADAFDVLLSERVYKKACSPDLAFQMIIQGECGVFSPKLMESFRNAKVDIMRYVEESAKNSEEES